MKATKVESSPGRPHTPLWKSHDCHVPSAELRGISKLFYFIVKKYYQFGLGKDIEHTLQKAGYYFLLIELVNT